MCSVPSRPSYHTEAGTDALCANAVIAALIVTALFPGIFARYEQPRELGVVTHDHLRKLMATYHGYKQPGHVGVSDKVSTHSGRSDKVSSYSFFQVGMRAGCASAVALSSGAIVTALVVQVATAARSVDPNVPLTAHQLNIGYLISLYLLLLSVANTLVVVAFGAVTFTRVPSICCAGDIRCICSVWHCIPYFLLLRSACPASAAEVMQASICRAHGSCVTCKPY